MTVTSAGRLAIEVGVGVLFPVGGAGAVGDCGVFGVCGLVGLVCAVAVFGGVLLRALESGALG